MADNTRQAWQRVAAEWNDARQHWRDGTTEYFEREYVWPMQQETERHVQAVERVMDVLRGAQQEIDRW